MTRAIVFIVDLVQDVNTLRPLMGLARQATSHELLVMASDNFERFDVHGMWARELREICGLLGIPIHHFSSAFEALQLLQHRSGLLISSSESDARAHAGSHALFLAAPPGFIRVTLQHGFECLGFLHNAAHDRSHWQSAHFNADVICGWFGEDRLRSISPSQSAKLVVTGPPLLIDCGTVFGLPEEPEDFPTSDRDGTETPEDAQLEIALEADGAEPPEQEPKEQTDRSRCLICENLHSVRLGSDVLKAGFIGQFNDFAGEAAALGWEVWLRPHPAGRYTDVKGVALPEGVQKSSGPIYKEDLKGFRLAISAPSSILLDFMLAGVPVAVWQDSEGSIDCRNYPWLPVVSDVEDWLWFAAAVLAEPEGFIARQNDLLQSLAMPDDVTASYLRVLKSVG